MAGHPESLRSENDHREVGMPERVEVESPLFGHHGHQPKDQVCTRHFRLASVVVKHYHSRLKM